MISEIKNQLRNDRTLKWMLLVMFLVQIVFCITQVGVYQLDQHFQVIEFSQYQLGKPSSATTVWELAAMIRPTIQVYMFSAYDELCEFLGITSQFDKLTILRLITGIIMFVFFNAITLYYLRNHGKKVLYAALILLNLSWCYAYTRTLFSSEMLSSLLFFAAVVWYDLKKEKQTFWFTLWIGFLLSLSFYVRFQMAFGIAGFGLWMLLFEKRYSRILPMAIGFIIGAGINMYLDAEFYNQFVFTPYKYYEVNILEGKAATFGTSSFLKYIGFIVQALFLPPLGLILFYYALKGSYKNMSHPFVLPVLLFVIGHSFVGHKEERFMFPILHVLPIIIGWTLNDFFNLLRNGRPWLRYTTIGLVVLSAVLNFFMLIFLMFNPYAQNIHFAKQLKKKFGNDSVTVHSLAIRSPLGADLQFTYYKKEFSNIKWKVIQDIDSIKNITDTGAYFVIRFKEADSRLKMLDSLGFKPQIYSSRLVWDWNLFARERKLPTVRDIWVLYRKE